MNRIFMRDHTTVDQVDQAFFDGKIEEEERYIWRAGYNAGWGRRHRRGKRMTGALVVGLLTMGLALGLLAQWVKVLLP